MSAILMIFFNLLLNPLDQQATEDLELLTQVPDTFKRIPRRQLPISNCHIKLIDDFVAELTRLATCAVVKAQHELRGRDK